MKAKFIAPVLGSVAGLLGIPSALAHCPLCTAATGAAVAVARVYGVPDSIVGVFVGAFAIMTGLWLNNVLRRRGWSVAGQAVSLSIASLVITIVSLQLGKLFIDSPVLWGLPGLLSGILLGAFVSCVAEGVQQLTRRYNNAQNIVPLQGMIVVLAVLLVTVVLMGVMI